MSIRENIAEIRRRIDEAARETGRTGADITLVGASKMNDAAACQEAIAAGIDVLGENRVQEMVAKLAENAYDGAPLHFIGHLQRNKVKQVVGKAALIQSAGSVELLDEIEKQAEKLDIVQDILLEVNIGDEASKGGAKRSDILALARHALQCPHLRLRGIMSIPPATATEEENKAFFQETYQLFIDMRNELGDNVSNIDCLSMGMSGDYPLAIAGGSTMVRVGTALFGARPPWHPQG